MKKIFGIFCVGLTALVLTACSTLSQVASLLSCSYRIENVNNPRLAGLGVSNAADLTSLDASTALKVTSTLFSGSLPMSATVNIGVSNPNKTAAQIAGLEWMLYFEGVHVLSGSTQQAVSVAPNGGRSVIPFTVQTDLVELFKQDNKDKMLKFANGLLHLGDQNAQVTLKVRPAISFGGQVFKMGFVTVSKAF